MTDLIKDLTSSDVSKIQLSEPIKLGGCYVAHASVDGKPVVFRHHPIHVKQTAESTIVFDLGESGRLGAHVVDIDQRLVAVIQQNTRAFFGRDIRPSAIESAYSSNAHDGTLTFPVSEDLVVKDQFGNIIPTDSITPDEPVTMFVELIGVAIGRVSIKPSWKLHKIQVYKKTKLDDQSATETDASTHSKQDSDNGVGEGTDVAEENSGFYSDADEPE